MGGGRSLNDMSVGFFFLETEFHKRDCSLLIKMKKFLHVGDLLSGTKKHGVTPPDDPSIPQCALNGKMWNKSANALSPGSQKRKLPQIRSPIGENFRGIWSFAKMLEQGPESTPCGQGGGPPPCTTAPESAQTSASMG